MQQDHLPRNQARSLIKEVREGDLLLALILPDRFSEPGIHFVTPGEFSQQLAYMRHPAGKMIEPHIHNKVAREVLLYSGGSVHQKGEGFESIFTIASNYIWKVAYCRRATSSC